MKIFVVLVAIFGICNCGAIPDAKAPEEEEVEETRQLCPEIIYYNASFWEAHFDMKYGEVTGIWWATEYTSEEMTDDLPPMYPKDALRPFAQHSYLMLTPEDKMWLVHYRTDMILHWYQGGAVRIYSFDPQTGKMEKSVLNARNVVKVIEAGTKFAMELRSVGVDQYVLLGCTMVPAAFDEDRFFTKPNEISSSDKSTQNTIVRFTKPI